jgi:beta-glucanase (GH16 family)
MEEKIINGKRYRLTFFDDFNGKELDRTKWSNSKEQHRQDTDCWWRDDAIYLDGKSNLVIESKLDSDGTHKCGSIETRGKFEQTYGFYECKFKVEKKLGYWSAFWLFSDKVFNEEGGSIEGSEIDIFEHVAALDLYACNIHWNGYGAKHKSVGNDYTIDDSFYDDFHVASFLWDKEIYNFYLDGRHIYSTVTDGICNVPLFMILSSEFGSWAKEPNDDELPGKFIIDYVKVYEEIR